MSDQWVAASILHASDAPVLSSRAKPSPSSSASHMYDRNGRRLTGLRGTAAQLMQDHRQFSSEEELHRLEQALAANKRSAFPTSSSAFGAHAPLPALPDMFGHRPSHPTRGMPNAEGEGGEGTRLVVSPSQRWSLVRRDGVRGAVGYRWARVDTLQAEAALQHALSAGRRVEGDTATLEDEIGREWNGFVSAIAEAPAEEETLTAWHVPVAAEALQFLTITSEEYNELQLDADTFQPHLEAERDTDADKGMVSPFRFDYATTCKLLTLYDRFGNFVVVADRWHSPETLSSAASLPAPPVEALMERYRLVSTAVLQHRQHLLRDALQRGSKKSAASSNQHPLDTLLAKHPLLVARDWYHAPNAFTRRKRLRAELEEESAVNVPHLRASAALRRVERSAEQLFDRLRILTQRGGKNEHSNKMEANKHSKKKKGSVGESEDGESYQSVLVEVRRIPRYCERLLLCVQSGWLLPPPTPSVTTTNSNPPGSAAVVGGGGGGGGGGTGGSATVGTGATTTAVTAATLPGADVVANRAFSNMAEALLLSLPSCVPRLHRAVEQELEKHLWEDHRALCEDSAMVQELVCEARVLYTQNVILRRFATRCGVLEAGLKKLAADAQTEEL